LVIAATDVLMAPAAVARIGQSLARRR